MIFEKPGKMSWRYTNNGNRVVSDGKLIKVYEKENKQMYEQPLEKSQYPAALAFLVGQGNLQEVLQAQRCSIAKQMKFEGGYVLVGEPREADARVPEDAPLRRRRRRTRCGACCCSTRRATATASIFGNRR